MITVKIIPDIFRYEGRQEFLVDHPGTKFDLSAFTSPDIYKQAGLAGQGITPHDFIESCDIWYEGRVIAPGDYHAVEVRDCSEIVFFGRPGKGGLYQTVIGAIFFALGFVPGLQFLTAVGITMMLGGAIQLLFPPEDAPRQNFEARSLHYGWQGAETEYATIGSMIPIPYGRRVTGGKCIHQRLYVPSGQEDQKLDLLLLLGEGEIRGVRKEDDSGILPKIKAATIAFHDNDPSADTITDSGNGFVDAGFVAGDKIVIYGSASNDGYYTIETVAAGTLTLIAEDELTDESAGDMITILCLSQSPWIKLDGKWASSLTGVTWDYRIGSLDQISIPGFSLLSTNYDASHHITENEWEDTWYTISNAGGGNNFESVEFNFYFPEGLYLIDQRGVCPHQVIMKIFKKEEPGGDWEFVGEWSKVEKRTGPFYWSIKIDDLGDKPYSFRLRRKWPERYFGLPECQEHNRIDLLNYNRLNYEDLQYPGCVLLALSAIASNEISSVQPNVLVKLDGRLLKYYTTSWQEELWDTGGGDEGDVGRNPAWQIHDLIYNETYGLGPYFDDSLKVSAKFKELADYANQQIDDGQGQNETENRFLSDVIIDGIVDPWDMLKQLLRACHTAPVVAGAQIWPVIEKERSPVMSFGMDNVATDEKGNTTFVESWRTLEDIPNVIEVQYFDQEKDYAREIVYFPDDDTLIPQGEKIRKFTAVFYNVTRRSHATRLAKYHWLITQKIKKFLQFATNEEAIALQPGDVFYFSHDIPQFDFSGKIFRVRLGDNIIELDNAWDDVPDSDTFKLLIRDLDDDTIEIKDVTAITTKNKRHLVTYTGSYSFMPAVGDPYILIKNTTVPIRYVCLELGRDEQMRRTISAHEYDPDIYDYVVDIEPVNYSDLPNPHDPPPAPTDLTLVEMPTQIGFFVNAVAPQGNLFYDHCRIYVSEDETNWTEVGRVKEVINFPVTQVLPGIEYYVKVVSFNREGAPCVNPPTASIIITGVKLPPKVRGLEIFGQGSNTQFVGKDCKIQWKLATNFLGLGAANLGHEGTGLGESQPYYIKDTKVSIYLNGIEKRTEFVPAPGNTFIYTLEKNIEDNGNPERSFEFRLWYRDNYNRMSPEPACLSVMNPAPSLAGKTPTVSDIPYGFKVEWTAPSHYDVDKYHVYCDENNPPTTIRARVSSHETLVNIVNLDPDVTYFVMVIPGDPYGMGTQSNIVQKSVPIPGVVVPVGPDDPTEPGELKGVIDGLLFDDCDDHTKWTSETGGIVLATDGEALKEGDGALKVGIDKYTCIAENLWYTIPNPPWPPQAPPAYIIGDSYHKYSVQGFKLDSNYSLKRIGIPLKILNGSPPGCKVMIYTANGDKPDTKLGEATFSGITNQEFYRWADFATPISLSAATQYYMIICRTDESGGSDCYQSRYGEDKYGDAEHDYFQYGNDLNNLTKNTAADILFRLFKNEATANNHFKITSLGTKDISTYPNFEYYIKSNKMGGGGWGNWLQMSMGEAALGEITATPDIVSTWAAISHSLSSIPAADRDAIAYFGFKVLDADPPANPSVSEHGKIWLWIDYIRAIKDEKVRFKFPSKVVTIYPAEDPGPGEGHTLILPWTRDSVGQGTWTWIYYTGYPYLTQYYNSTLADGDNLSWKRYLAKGTYTLKLLACACSDAGIVDIDIDGEEIASFNLYDASGDADKINTQANIVISESGIKTIRLRVDGKNASSSSYRAQISMIDIYRTE